jgi:uncharacterized protein YjeT (DUF2065 family)
MNLTSLALIVIAILAICEGIILLVSPKWAKKIMMHVFKDSDVVRKIGFSEAILGIILLFLGLAVR